MPHQFKDNQLSRKQVLADLSHIVDINSGSYHSSGVNAVIDFCDTFLEQLGFQTLRHRGTNTGDCLVAHRDQGRGSRLMALGHADTVFPATDSLRAFSCRGDRCFGPGVGDMKGGLIVMLHGLAEAFRACSPTFPISVVINGDEEISSPFSRKFIEKEARRSAAALVFEPAPSRRTVITERQGRAGLVLKVAGKAAHAGKNPEKGVSAIVEMAHQIIAIEQLSDFSKRSTVVTSLTRGGQADNVVPPSAEAELDVRFSTMTDYKIMLKNISSIVASTHLKGARNTLRGGITHSPVTFSPKAMPLLKTLKKAAGVSGWRLSRSSACSGSSDASWISRLGVPVIDGLGPMARKVHSSREYIITDSLFERIHLFADFLEQRQSL